jgi:hypothetical protein
MTISRTLLLFVASLTASLPLVILAADDKSAPASTDAKSADAKSKDAAKSTKGSATTPKEEFKKAGASGENYEKAGRAAGKGGQALGQKTADGDIVGGAADFGKGMGTTGKEIGVGTAKVGTSVGRGVGRVFGGKKKTGDKADAKSGESSGSEPKK